MPQNGGNGQKEVSATWFAGLVTGGRELVLGKKDSWNPKVIKEGFVINLDTSRGKEPTYREEYPATVNR